MSETNMKHFKTAQIAGMEVSLKDLEKINSYALSKLEPADIFAFKVSMAGNEIDRDYEVFPRSTLVKLANLFVGKTVVKDHDHRSDNQIARIYSTELVENDLARMTKTGEVFTQLIAKCYMVKTSRNADLIAEIQAGIRKEVSLGCRVDKAICSICGTDNVKTYCEHFPGKRYNNNQLCYFSLENASDAYELSFVAVPAQAHAGTVKSYGKKPCCEEEIMERKKALADARKKTALGENETESESRLTVNREECAEVRKAAPNSPNNGQTSHLDEPKDGKSAPNDAKCASNEETETSSKAEPEKEKQAGNGDDFDAKEMLKQLHEIAQQLLTCQKALVKEKEADRSASLPETDSSLEQKNGEHPSKPSSNEGDGKSDSDQEEEDKDDESRLTVNRDDAQEKLEKNEPSPCEKIEPALAVESNEGNEPDDSDSAAEEERAVKDKTAQARLRALDLALSLRKKH